jgi:hypothetical protein
MQTGPSAHKYDLIYPCDQRTEDSREPFVALLLPCCLQSPPTRPPTPTHRSLLPGLRATHKPARAQSARCQLTSKPLRLPSSTEQAGAGHLWNTTGLLTRHVPCQVRLQLSAKQDARMPAGGYGRNTGADGAQLSTSIHTTVARFPGSKAPPQWQSKSVGKPVQAMQ